MSASPDYIAEIKHPNGTPYHERERPLRHLYGFYLQTTDNPVYIGRDNYLNILREFNKAMEDDMFDRNIPYYMPHGLGQIIINKTKREPYVNKDGKLIYPKMFVGGKLEAIDASSTNWYIWVINWRRRRRLTSRKTRLYNFSASQKLKKRLIKLIKNNEAYKFNER